MTFSPVIFATFIEELLFDFTELLLYPVLILAILAFIAVVIDMGGLFAELYRRRGRSSTRLRLRTDAAIHALAAGDTERARTIVTERAKSKAMAQALSSIIDQYGGHDPETEVNKCLSDYDYRSIKRLERSRILVRMGPALGLMGTLIPLSPALAGLASGDIDTLTENLRVAFSVTVAGLMIGALAFGISLVRDRLYGQDFSDVEYVATRLLPYLKTHGHGGSGHAHGADHAHASEQATAHAIEHAQGVTT